MSMGPHPLHMSHATISPYITGDHIPSICRMGPYPLHVTGDHIPSICRRGPYPLHMSHGTTSPPYVAGDHIPSICHRAPYPLHMSQGTISPPYVTGDHIPSIYHRGSYPLTVSLFISQETLCLRSMERLTERLIGRTWTFRTWTRSPSRRPWRSSRPGTTSIILKVSP